MLGQTLLELYECNPSKLDDPQRIRRAIEHLTQKFQLTRLCPISLIYTWQDGKGTKRQHDGIVRHVIIAESHIDVHVRVPPRYATVDLFSCKEYDENYVVDYWTRSFGAQRVKKQTIVAEPPTMRELPDRF